ncbi:MAG: dTMP kinase [Clostridia bacterium]|nr:dTMP kinase [Clostridia bacterium]
MDRGKLIVFEGIDGSGKGTQIKLLAEKLDRIGKEYVLTKEPTDGNIGKLLRQYLTRSIEGDERSVAALFAADRLDHIFGKGGMLDLIDKGKTVICDRYYLSSYAYHSVGVDMDWVISMNSEAAAALRPYAQIFIDVSPETAMERIKARGEKLELFEELERLTRVRNNYFAAMEKLADVENLIIVDGARSPETVAEEVFDRLGLE